MPLTKVRTGGVADNAITATQLPSDFSNGITFFETMRMTASMTGTGGDLSQTFESTDTGSFGRKLIGGTGMTASSGVFTFPATGIYLLMGRARFNQDADLSYFGINFRSTTDNFSSVNDVVVEGYGTWGQHIGGNNYDMACIDYIFDCTNTSTHKFKMVYGSSHQVTVAGCTSGNNTYVTVVRLGDT